MSKYILNSNEIKCYVDRIRSELEKIDFSKPITDSRIVEVLASKRIKKIYMGTKSIECYIFEASKESYIVIPAKLCTCIDFMINVAMKCLKTYCYHILAVEYARRSGKYAIIDIDKLDESLKMIFKIIISGTSR